MKASLVAYVFRELHKKLALKIVKYGLSKIVSDPNIVA
jgi:hypothetical protein